MSPEDFEFAVRITDQMGWHLAKEDFEFMKELEPEGCFVLLSNMEKIGIATTISFDKIGWFGNLMVNEAHRKKGAGSLLVEHALQYLKTKSVETVGLYAYIQRIPFYERLGFKYDSEFAVLDGKAISSPTKASVMKTGKEDMQKIIDYDGLCFGASRRKLLEPMIEDSDNLCYFTTEKGEMTGYGVAKVYGGMAEIGPLICSEGRSDVAINLLTAILNRLEGLQVSMCVPAKQGKILDMLKKSGIAENFRVARMFFGTRHAKDCICAAESLERG
jgi:GNAT superfamily N-acetyltransferase